MNQRRSPPTVPMECPSDTSTVPPAAKMTCTVPRRPSSSVTGLPMLNDLHSIPISREHLRKTGHLGDGCRVGRLGSRRRREKTNSAKQPEKHGGIGRFRPRFNHVTDISNAPRFAEQAREPDDQESCSRFFEIARGARASRSRHSQLSSRVVEWNDALDVATRIENPNLT
jgi:hypothetical protein